MPDKTYSYSVLRGRSTFTLCNGLKMARNIRTSQTKQTVSLTGAVVTKNATLRYIDISLLANFLAMD
jgi:hypothetical protein